MNDLWRLGATQLSTGFRNGSFTPLDALQSCLERAALWQPHHNAFALLDEPGARAAAEASTARWASGHPLSELDGVPVSLKDNLHVQGLPTRWGSRLEEERLTGRPQLALAVHQDLLSTPGGAIAAWVMPLRGPAVGDVRTGWRTREMDGWIDPPGPGTFVLLAHGAPVERRQA